MHDITPELRKIAGEAASDMKVLRRQLHRCPEPAYEETETAAAVVDHLRRIDGMEIHTGIGRTGVVALLGRERPGHCIALRADMDCLRMEEKNCIAHASCKKGLMHGCGHDGHVACLVGAAQVLGRLREHLPGPIKFIFQPGEESAAGAAAMIKDGALDNPAPRAIFGLHGTPSLPLGKIGLRCGPMMAASRYFHITVSGRGTHAAMPHKGVDTVLAASHIVCAAHTIVSRNISPNEAALISIPRFEGSTAPNVMPAEVTLEGTLRALSTTTRKYLEQRLTEVASCTARAYGAEAIVRFDGGYPLLENDRICYDYVRQVAGMLLPAERIDGDYSPSLGAEDFAFYLEQVPGAFWWLGLGVLDGTDFPLHNPCFDFNDDALQLGIMLHCLLALHSSLLR